MKTTRQLWKLLKAGIKTLSDFSEEELRQLEKWDFLRDDIMEHRMRQLTQDGFIGLKEKIEACIDCGCATKESRIIGYGSRNPKVLFVVARMEYQETITKITDYAGTKDFAVVPIQKCKVYSLSPPDIKELRKCIKFLRAQIQILNPRTIIFLGSIPLKAFTPISMKYGIPEIFSGRNIMKLYPPEALEEHPGLIRKQKTLIDLNREIL